jgi:hypothetical protein
MNRNGMGFEGGMEARRNASRRASSRTTEERRPGITSGYAIDARNP